jgi:1-deoxy-D-xylulose-5-phosphate reductoisomerase
MPNSNTTRSIAILGATGSIGDSTTDIILANRDRFRVTTLVGHSNIEKLAERAIQLGAEARCRRRRATVPGIERALGWHAIDVAAGREAVIAAAAESADLVVCAMVGAPGIEPAMAAIQAGNTVALANKEALVCAGPVMMKLRSRQRREDPAARLRAQRAVSGL